MYVCMYTYIYIYICKCIYIHTYPWLIGALLWLTGFTRSLTARVDSRGFTRSNLIIREMAPPLDGAGGEELHEDGGRSAGAPERPDEPAGGQYIYIYIYIYRERERLIA